VEAAGQLIHLFRDGLDYAFILHVSAAGMQERGVLFGFLSDPNPSAGSSAPRISRPMSLYGAADVGRPPPLGVAMTVSTAVGFTE
jgi:hypothetical protein